ncbi:hypothetical protein D6D21_08577 [Aureobasidium pullulans]|uniref:Uncharacterized protein n=1 Tax=Aureobasidium pullulans TaxID=5580 RepID=A0AB74INK2_AURPU|nr:hypothetical protein D6D21_08577 [Aureobasidium pullulans]
MCLLVSRIDASSQDLLHLADLLRLLAAEQLPSARAMICASVFSRFWSLQSALMGICQLLPMQSPKRSWTIIQLKSSDDPIESSDIHGCESAVRSNAIDKRLINGSSGTKPRTEGITTVIDTVTDVSTIVVGCSLTIKQAKKLQDLVATKLPIAGRLHLTAVSQASRVSKNKASTAYHKLKNEIYRDISAAPTSDPRSRQLKRWLAWDRELATPVICVTTGRRKVHTHYSAALAPGNRRGSLGRGVLLLPVSSKIKVDMDKLFGMAGYKTKASTNTAYHKLKAKIKSVSSTAEADEADAEDCAAPSSPVKKSRGKKAVLVKAESDSEDDDEADEIAPTKPTASGRSSRVTANKHAALKAKMAARPSIGRATRASARTNKVDVQMSEDSSWVQATEEVAWPGTVHTDQHFKPS